MHYQAQHFIVWDFPYSGDDSKVTKSHSIYAISHASESRVVLEISDMGCTETLVGESKIVLTEWIHHYLDSSFLADG